MEVLKFLGYQTSVESRFQVKLLEHDVRTEMLQVQNKNSLRAEGYYADVGKKLTKNGCLTYAK